MEVGPNGSNTVITSTFQPPDYLRENKTLQIEKFYQTYDVMTGVRIGATLGAFFALMVILILYKSKSKTEKALKDPDFTAAAVAEVEEEDRQLAAALEDTVYHQLNPRKSRKSLDTSSMPSGWIRPSPRFSSVGGYSSLMDPPTRPHSRLPSFIGEDSPPEEEHSFYEDLYSRHLDVPRRPSNVTCSSSGSSYLERRDSAVILGWPPLPAHKSRNRRRQSSPLPEYEFFYPIDIKVIQPTPGGSPCGSDRALYDQGVDPQIVKKGLAPLASISSCNSSLGLEYSDIDYPDCASDSVFRDNGEEDTDNEIEEFSTDSDVNSEELGACCKRKIRHASSSSDTTLTDRHHCVVPEINIVTSHTSIRNNPDEHMQELRVNESISRASTSSGKLGDESWAQETLF